MSVPAFLAAVHGRSADGARAALSPGFTGKANGKPLDRDGQVRLLESFWMGFPDGNFTMEPTGGSGRHVITWTFSGTHDGLYLGVPPTGKPVTFSGFIISVSDATGITSLDWKWDTKVFTKAVLGPDEVGDIVVKDNFRDPSARWQRGPAPGGQRRKKGKGPKPGVAGQPGQAGGRPQGAGRPPSAPRLGPDGQPLPPPAPVPVLGPDGQPVLGPDGQPLMRTPGKRRRRRGRGPKPGAPDAAVPEAGDAASAQPEGPPAAAEGPGAAPPPEGA